jgi:hypothetical protein
MTVPRGAKTVAELEHAVALLRTRDAAQARAIKALRGDVDRIEAMLERQACDPLTAGAAKLARGEVNLDSLFDGEVSLPPAHRFEWHINPWPIKGSERQAPLSPACPNSTPPLPRRIAGAAQRIARSFLNLFRSTSGKA